MSLRFGPLVAAGIVAVTCSLQTASVDAARILIDLGRDDGTNGDATVGADVNGNYWNNLASPTSNVPAGFGVSELITDDNLVTTVAIETVDGPTGGDFGANGYRNGGLSSLSTDPLAKDPDPALFDTGSTSFGYRPGGDYAIPTVTGDYFFIQRSLDGAEGAGLVISGLDPSKSYDFDVFGTRETTSFRVTRFTATGVNSSSVDWFTSGTDVGFNDSVNPIYDGNDAFVANLDGITPTAAGQVEITVSQGFFNGSALGDFFYLGALGINGDFTIVPEPATATLVGVLGVFVAGARRQRT